VTAPTPPVRIRICETVVARIAQHCALRTPGVVALHPDLGPTLLAAARPGPAARPPGVIATVTDGSADAALTVVTRLGHSCRDVAQAVQRDVAAAVLDRTGLPTTVTVTIAEILLD
jgi:uncharacterized alkaline shock family protein YloU